MCGRYIPNTEDEIMEIREILSQISIRLSQEEAMGLAGGGEVRPTQMAPVIRCGEAQPYVARMKWGFKKWDNVGQVINARSETACSSRFFGPHTGKGRCIVPAHGYLEWKKEPDGGKTKYIFEGEEPGCLLLAGLCRDAGGGAEFVILTKDADERIADIHDRMPLILAKDAVADWLGGRLPVHGIGHGMLCGVRARKAA